MKKSVVASSRTFAPSLSYRYRDALYLNITSRCPTACEFCIKFTWNYQYRSHNLLLKKDPEVQEILASADDPSQYGEIVFCGYGESTYRLEEMKVIAGHLRDRGAKKIRLNTIGLGNLIHGRNIVPDLARFLDSVSVSLNTSDPKKWVEIHHPIPQFRENGYEGTLQFIRECSKVIPQTFVTAIETIEKDMESFEKLVHSLGAQLRARPYLDDYEER